VDIFASTTDFVAWLKKMPGMLDRTDRAEIEELILRCQRA
jgi:hypothetical protein